MSRSRASDPPTDTEQDSTLNDSDEEGWEDAEVDGEDVSIVCLFCTETFPSSEGVFEHCAVVHGFEYKALRKELGLDFYGCIKLINYIRSEVAQSHVPDFTMPVTFVQDDKYLRPVLEDDALLFGLGDEEEEEECIKEGAKGLTEDQKRIQELEERLKKLELVHSEYREAVNRSLEMRLGEDRGDKKEGSEDDSHYFESYSGNDIHEIMLKDTVRTDGYRDFIYENKHLFEGKVVLDVGCGTGVLSMFCAKAGAKKVIAVDNSTIINKATANVFENSLDGVITCIRGKIEEVTLPVKQVDIIVSEWMGYVLLYEAMLDSVLFARDKYLAPGGLMVPSECKILIAAMHDSEYMNENVNFWNHVYGFSMTAMKEKIREDVVITGLNPSSLASEPVAFCHLSLHTIKTSDLTFTKPFQLSIKQNIESLDAFVIYFDTFFTTSRNQLVPENARAESWKDGEGGAAFTTGPFGKLTHWKQGVLLVEKKSGLLREGEAINGEVTYKKRSGNSREVEVEIEWKVESRKDKQVWYMR
ncbi:S-adenosyl-L-methionine-dependent methyltransferase [Tuber borchii]|uniref:type I protein arginine methyltransferase n=1 Tax=Tuber borchii TaxID=42251 RepID=A0A2T7A7T9_TUBBO|nr:S-adenosyl-L-methionine-dependent methyltransferase [Tuber borchii]